MKKTSRKGTIHAVLLVGAVALFAALVLLFAPSSFVDAFVKARITEGLRSAYPAYSIRIGGAHYGVLGGRLRCDSVVVEANDSSLRCAVAVLSVRGVGWLQVLMGGGRPPDYLRDMVLEADNIVLAFPASQYVLECERLRVSLPDSEIVIDALTFHPSGNDGHWFARSESRQTRFRLAIPHITAAGVAGLELMQGGMYRVRSAHISDASIDVLINKDRPVAEDRARPPMPNEIVASFAQGIAVGDVTITNARLQYGEQMAAGSHPALITLDSMQVSVLGIENRGSPGDTVLIRAHGEFMKSGKIHVAMALPVSSPEFSFAYSGSLGRMPLSALNPFLGPAEQMRITSGMLQEASFDIEVIAGLARGSVRVAYSDLTVAAIDKHTGSERGVMDVITSFVANSVTLRTNNMPGHARAMKVGIVTYTRQQNDPFFGFAWFALRSGLGDVVGF